MSPIRTKFYFENTAGIRITSEAAAIIQKQIEMIQPKCETCGAVLGLVRMMEAEFLSCPNDMYNHINHWKIWEDHRLIEPPHIFLEINENI